MKDKENNATENPETSTPPISDPEMANANNKKCSDDSSDLGSNSNLKSKKLKSRGFA